MTAAARPSRIRPSAADVQRFGLLSAATVVARYAQVVDRAISGDGTTWLGAPPDGVVDPRGLVDGAADPQWLVDDAARVAEAFLRLLDAGAALVERAQAAAAPTAEEVLALPASAPGGTSEATLWVHGSTETAVTVALHVTPLVSGEGHLVVTPAVQCRPDRLDSLAAGASCAVGIHVAVPVGQPAGRYHGLVVASHAPEPVRVVLEVTDGAPS